MQTLVCELKDNGEGDRTVKLTVVAENGFLEIRPKGYGELGAEDGFGSPVFLEVYDGELRVHVCADINHEGPTHTISLEGARENRRKEASS